MSNKPKITYDTDTAEVTLNDIRKDAINDQIGWFLSMCLDSGACFYDVVEVMSNIRYLHTEGFTNEEPRLLSYEEVRNADVLICWCEEICYDPEWAEEGCPNSISDWVVPCVIVATETFTCSGSGDIGRKEDYGIVKRNEDGCLIGFRYWTNGKIPTFEQLKANKWNGLEGYEYE